MDVKERTVHLRGKPSNRWYKNKKDDLSRKVKWLKGQVKRQRKLLNSYQVAFDRIARVSPQLAARYLGKVNAVVIRGPGDPSGRSDTFQFPLFPSLKEAAKQDPFEGDGA
jgi:hypothetical protein